MTARGAGREARRGAAEALIAFHTTTGRDAAGRTIEDIWAFDGAALEHTHDYIQWLFPLAEPSQAQPSSPVLTSAAREAIVRTPLAMERLERSARVMASFYGFEVLRAAMTCSAWRVVRTPSFVERQRRWLTPGNHNYLRHTRILRSLALLEHVALARAWLACLVGIYSEHATAIGDMTVAYWRAASEPAVPRAATDR